MNKFLTVSLKSESLSKIAAKEKSKVEESLQKLYADFPSLSPHNKDEGSASSAKDQISGTVH